MPVIIGTQVIATVDAHGSTIRHSKCISHLIAAVDDGRKRCEACEHYRRTLHSMLACKENCTTDKTAPNSHVNHRYLSSPEKVDKIQRLHTLQKLTKQQLDRVSAKISQSIHDSGIEVDDVTHADLVAIAQENSTDIDATCPIKKLIFWDQQKKAASLCNARSMYKMAPTYD